MAQFHVYASVIQKTKGQGRSRDFAAYLERQDMENATQTLRYLARDGRERKDLVASGSAHLPPWAIDAQDFWSQADRYENGGDLRAGVLARHCQITLPRELSPEGRLDLAEDIRTVFFREYPHTWAVHCPPAKEGPGDNPHLHVMFSTRRDDTGRICEPALWFRKAAKDGAGGIRKDISWDTKERLQGLRYETMLLANAALEREGHAVAMTHDKLRGLGLDRAGVHYGQFAPAEVVKDIQAQQAVLRADWHPWEQDTLLRAWQDTKAREHLTDLSRDAMVDHCRDRFWLHDRSPLREAEREASVERTIVRGFHNAGLDRIAVQEAHEAQRQRGQLSAERPHPAHGRRTALRALLAEEEGLGRHGHDLAIRLHTEGEGRGR